MNKEEFLKELRAHLRVLDEKEQQDIIDEYAQHIDLKMKSGLNEEEAIRDFGNVEELAGDILEAYHVNPKFEETTKGIVLRKPDMEEVSKTTKKLAEKGKAFWERIKAKLHRMKTHALECWNKILPGKERKQGRRNGEKENPVFHTGKRWLWNSCIFVWNLLCLFLTFCLIGSAAFCLFGFGVTLILVFSGYPLLGVEIFCFGAAVSGTALGLLVFRLRKSYRKKLVDVQIEEVA